MRKIRMAVLAGGATLLLTGAAMAASRDLHVMKVALPDGSEAQITYQGDVAPKVRVCGGPAERIAFDPVVAFDPAPFAEMDRVAAMLDRQAELAMQQAAAIERAAAAGHAPQMAAGDKPVPGMVSYSYVSTTTSDGGCTRTVEWRSDGTSAQPKMTRTSAGSCPDAHSGEAAQPLKAAAPAPAPVAAPAPRTRV
jgi:hypothetical protein